MRPYIKTISSLPVLFVGAAMCFLFTVAAQDPVYRVINKSTGLPSNSVYNILQDKQGFVWLGHDKGLSRYDGKFFKQYNSNTQQGKSLSNLNEGGNTIWCQDFSGNFYYVKGDSVVRDAKFKTVGYYNNSSILKKRLLVSVGNNFIQTLNVITGAYNKYSIESAIGKAICYESDKLLIVGNKTLAEFDGDKIKNIGQGSQSVDQVFFIQKFGGEYYGVSKNSYPVVSILKNNRFSPLPLLKPGLFVQDVTVIDDLLWISTSSGAWCFGLDMKPAFNGHCFFEGKSITRIMKDREGSYWFGTLDNGVLFVPDINNRLHTYNDEKFTTIKIASNAQNLYVGTSNNRILSFDLYTSQFTNVFKGTANHEVLTINDDSDKSQLVISSDRVFMVKGGKGINELSIAGKSFVSISKNLYAMAYSGGISIIAKTKGMTPAIPAWLKNEGDRWDNNHFLLTKTVGRGRSVAFNPIDSTLYAATSLGVFYFSPKGNGKITENGKEIYASQIVVDGKVVYAATFTNGLYKITNGNVAKQIVCNGEQVAKTIYRIFKSEDWLWLVGDDFLQRYDPDKNVVIELSEADGLPKAEIKDVAAQNSKLYIATTDGLAELDEYSSTENRKAPLLVINKMLVNGVLVNWLQKLKLKARQNNIEIDFSLLAFKEQDSLLVEYRINRQDWKKLAPGSRVISLSALAAGSYTIEVRGFNEDGIQSENIEKISFLISAPFYKQLWFLVGLLLLGMAIVYFYFIWRLKNEKKRNELLSQKTKLEQELQQSLLSSIKSQMNPHFLFNALNTIQSYIYTNDKENASQYLGKFSELTRMILDMSNKEIVPLSEEIKALTLYLELEQLRFEEKLSYVLTVDEAISTETTYIHSMLIQPYVENAIKHGLLHQKNNWKLFLDFTKVDSYIKVTVDDNGIGRKRSEELNKLRMRNHQSFASSANQKRLEILNKGLNNSIALEIVDKENEYGQPTGTKVVITIPISNTK